MQSKITQLLQSIAQIKQEYNVDQDGEEGDEAPPTRAPGAVEAAFVTELLTSLRALGADALHAEAITAIDADPATFDPVTVVVPALAALRAASKPAGTTDADLARLWRHAAAFLLARSEQPPAPPTDWAQPLTLACRNEDDRELQAFARDPARREHRFRVKKERRQHLHRIIEQLGLDMTHVTERQGSPQTLVCTKTRRTFERQCAQHGADAAAMRTLLASPPAPLGSEGSRLAARMSAASQRHPEPGPSKAGR